MKYQQVDNYMEYFNLKHFRLIQKPLLPHKTNVGAMIFEVDQNI